MEEDIHVCHNVFVEFLGSRLRMRAELDEWSWIWLSVDCFFVLFSLRRREMLTTEERIIVNHGDHVIWLGSN